MSTKIRMMRMGAMKRPFYRLVVVDSRNRRDGRYIENVGTYNPIPKETEVTLKEDRILDWLSKGAQPSGTVESLLRNAGILERFQLIKAGTPPEELEAKLEEWRAKLPKASSDKMSRADKKQAKKQAERDAAAAKIAAEEAEAKAAAAAEAKEKAKAEAAEAKAKAEAEAAEAKAKAEAEAAEAPAEEAPAAEDTEA